jgi:ferredoxin
MTALYYFSGTGNTLRAAAKIAECLRNGGEQCVLFNIAVETQKGPVFINADKAVFLFPAYAYQSPFMVRRFIEAAEIRSPYIAALVTFGSSPGGALAEISRALRRKKTALSFAGRIPSVENYIPIFGPQPDAKKTKRLALQEKASGEMARAVSERRTNTVWTFRPLSSLVSALLRTAIPLFVKKYTVSGECNGCGLCSRICPAAAITIKDLRPEFSPWCEHCQACFNWCPRHAVSFLRFRRDTPQYHHPDVKAADMIKLVQ